MRTLRAGSLSLEPQVAAHAAELFAVLGDPGLYTFTDDRPPESEAWLRDRYARLENRRSPDGKQQWLNWVVRNVEAEAAGYVQATVSGDAAAIAYVVGRRFWRRGYAGTACAAMLAELRETYGVTRATASVDPGNVASLALLRKLGFAPAGRIEGAPELRFVRDL